MIEANLIVVGPFTHSSTSSAVHHPKADFRSKARFTRNNILCTRLYNEHTLQACVEFRRCWLLPPDKGPCKENTSVPRPRATTPIVAAVVVVAPRAVGNAYLKWISHTTRYLSRYYCSKIAENDGTVCRRSLSACKDLFRRALCAVYFQEGTQALLMRTAAVNVQIQMSNPKACSRSVGIPRTI